MPTDWEPSPQDAMRLAALRWFANTIENFSIELYATDRTSFEAVETVLRETLRELKSLRAQFPLSANRCPDGYVLCHGVCSPSCDGEEEAEAAAVSRGAAKG